MERLLAHPVARQQQRTLPDVPDGEGEHAVEMVHAVFAPRLVCVHEDLGIGPRAKTMSQTLQVSAERQEVVDLAVQGAPARAGLVGARLITGFKVANAEASNAQREEIGRASCRERGATGVRRGG